MMIGSHFCFIERWQAFGMRNHLFQSSMWQRQRAFPNNVSQAVRPHYFDLGIRPPCPILYTDPFIPLYISWLPLPRFKIGGFTRRDFLNSVTQVDCWEANFASSPNQLKTGAGSLASSAGSATLTSNRIPSKSLYRLFFLWSCSGINKGFRSRCAASDGADSEATAVGGLTGTGAGSRLTGWIEINRWKALCDQLAAIQHFWSW